MIANDVLRSVRYMLDLSDAKVAEIMRLADPAAAVDKADVQAWLRKDEDEGHVPCSDLDLARFLDGLVIYCRGRNDALPPRPLETRVTNNVVLKKLRVAFEMKDVDVLQAFAAGGRPLSKPEANALFRQPGHANYRPCGDQLLRYFLRGVTRYARGGDAGARPGEA